MLKGALMLQVWESPQARPTMDIDMLAKTGNDPDKLMQAITATFDRRGTPVPTKLLFDPGFAREKQVQWRAFRQRLGDNVPAEPEFANVLMVLEQFMGTALESSVGEAHALHWSRGGRWQRREKGW